MQDLPESEHVAGVLVLTSSGPFLCAGDVPGGLMCILKVET